MVATEARTALILSTIPNNLLTPAKGNRNLVTLSGEDYAAFYTTNGLLVRCFDFDGERFGKVIVSQWKGKDRGYVDIKPENRPQLLKDMEVEA